MKMFNFSKEGEILKKGFNISFNPFCIKYVYGNPKKCLNPVTFLNEFPVVSEFSKVIIFRRFRIFKVEIR